MPSDASNALTVAHRAQQAAISADVSRQVLALWGVVDPRDVERAWPVVSRALSRIIAQGYATSTATAVAYMRTHAAMNGVNLTEILQAPTIAAEQIDTAMRVTGPVAVKRAAASGMAPEAAARAAAVQIVGSSSRLALTGGRATIEQTAVGSSQVAGWRRVGGGGRSCYFCAMLISRGAVYTDKATAGGNGNHYHDHCHCSVEMLYAHEPEPPEVTALYQQWLDHSTGSGPEAIRSWRQAYDGHLNPLPIRSSILGRDLASMTDDGLAAMLGKAKSDAEVDHVVAELDRRDAVAQAQAKAEAKAEADRLRRNEAKAAKLAAQDAEYDRLLATGMDAEQAYADAFGTTVEAMRREQVIASLRANGYKGSNLESLARDAFSDHARRAYLDAEDATHGFLLNKEAARAGIDPASLFTGPESRARKYASDELRGYWQDHGGRLTLDDFVAGLLGGEMRVKGAAAWA